MGFICDQDKVSFRRWRHFCPAMHFNSHADALCFRSLVSPDKPGGSDRLVVWLGIPSSKTTDETAAPQLQFSENAGGEEESTFNDDDGMIKAIAAELKGQRWDTDKAAWK